MLSSTIEYSFTQENDPGQADALYGPQSFDGSEHQKMRMPGWCPNERTESFYAQTNPGQADALYGP